MAHYRLLIDLATDRVIWYTEDLTAQLHTDEHSVQAEYTGELPEGMTHANAWNFVYRNRTLINTEVPTNPPKSLLETNRESINKFLINKINEKRLQKYPRVEYKDYIDFINFDNASKFIKGEMYDAQPLYIVQKTLGLNGIDEAARKIIQQKNEKDAFLLSSELLLLETAEKIKNANTSDTLFFIRSELTDKLRTI